MKQVKCKVKSINDDHVIFYINGFAEKEYALPRVLFDKNLHNTDSYFYLTISENTIVKPKEILNEIFNSKE